MIASIARRKHRHCVCKLLAPSLERRLASTGIENWKPTSPKRLSDKLPPGPINLQIQPLSLTVVLYNLRTRALMGTSLTVTSNQSNRKLTQRQYADVDNSADETAHSARAESCCSTHCNRISAGPTCFHASSTCNFILSPLEWYRSAVSAHP